MRVLVIEDSATALQMVVALLRSVGCLASTATDGKRAIELIGAEVFDLILTDMELPDCSGIEIAQGVRASTGPNRFTAIVGLTATVTEALQLESRQAGMVALLPKPLRRVDFERIVRVLAPQHSNG